MDDEDEDEELGEEIPGEQTELKSVPGESPGPPPPTTIQLPVEEVILEKLLSFEEASSCLSNLGKDESGIRYAYLSISPTDRKLTNIEMILKFKHVFFVDVSGNYLNLEALQILAEMPFLIMLKAQRNKVESAALEVMPFLQVLSLQRNQITETCDISQPILETLDLNYNQIYTAQFAPERLTHLKQLEMRGNQLFDLSGTYPPTLENLYLAENKISKIHQEDIEQLVNLKILHLRDNNIHKLNGFSSRMVNLKYLNLRQNKITKFRYFRKLQVLPNLETLVISQNPVCGDQEPKPPKGEDDEDEDAEEEEAADSTRIPLLILLPNLRRINKTVVTLDERDEAYEVRQEKLEEIMGEESSEDEDEMPTTTDITTDFTTEQEEEQEQFEMDVTDNEEGL